jgi:TPP-dependent pyruvate/acetoin dehydrogenase alpha subunit
VILLTTVDEKKFLDMYKTMLLIRRLEERIAETYAKGGIPGEMHLYCGQEAIAVGVCSQLRDTDTATSTHRAHGELVAKGVDLKKMVAELFGRSTGLCRGKGGHMHLFDTSIKFSCSGIVGASMPPALGAAFASKYKDEDNVSVAFFGDGAANQGMFHESMNLAALWKLPVIFVCEDNEFGISVRKSESTSTDNNIMRAKGYGIPAVLVDGNDLLAVYDAAKEAVERARSGKGPSFIECTTFRLMGHFEGDPEVYKSEEEQQQALKNEPIERFKKYLQNKGNISDDNFTRIDKEVKQEIQEAFEYAEKSPWPRPEEALENVFTEGSVGE